MIPNKEKAKSERHHWWPKSVSEFWKNKDGFVNWIRPDGEVTSLTPHNLGVIGNGHYLKMSDDPNESTPWDRNFETDFDAVDSRFRYVIGWLESLTYEERLGQKIKDRFVPQKTTDKEISELLDCIISLAVRSPRTREKSVIPAKEFRPDIGKREVERIITSSLIPCMSRATTHYALRGKCAVLYSDTKEFIFGDGFYHNVIPPIETNFSPKILVPITPNIAVAYSKPLISVTSARNPRLSTIFLTNEEVSYYNNVVQIYSKNMLFFRNEKPELTGNYIVGEHKKISYGNPVDGIIAAIAG